MAWFEDLSPCDYFGHRPLPFAVGWLERGCEFSRGQFDADVRACLFDLLAEPWQPFVFRGYHTCSLCDLPEPNHMPNHGWLNLFIPQGDRLYAAPSSIKHYIQEHQYVPPQAFQDAVLACPPMGSDAYFEALRATPAGEALLGSR